MSGGRKEKRQETLMITLDPEEFNEVTKRLHQKLQDQLQEAKERRDKRATKQAVSDHVEAAKELFVLVHMMELIDHLTEEVATMRENIEKAAELDPDMPELFAPKRTDYLN